MRTNAGRMRLVALLAFARLAGAQQSIPIRQLGAIEAKSVISMGNVYQIHARSDGRALVNDAIQQRLLLFDSTLTTYRVLADNSGNAPTRYGADPLELVAFRGDSTLVLDGTSLSFSVYDASGRITRVIAAPKPKDVMTIIGYGSAALDSRGRLVYRGTLLAPAPPQGLPGTAPIMILQPDSAPIVRGDFETRRIDTIAMIGVPTSRTVMTPMSNGGFSRTSYFNPLPRYDVWTVTSDGTLAIVRAQDYHVDWVYPDGTRTSSAKMPFDWRRISDAEKVAIVDSARAAIEKRELARRAQMPAGSAASTFKIEVVNPRELPDYFPPFKQGSVRADRDGNIWLPPTTSFDAKAGQVLYNVVNKKGAIAERVQVPIGHLLVGFGVRGAMYLTTSDSSGVYLERARIR